jgi:glycerol-3-phosphate dehydrogenase
MHPNDTGSPWRLSEAIKTIDGKRRLTMNATSHQNADARYAAALELVRTIDEHLRKRTRHYRDTQGRLLLTLDEVIQAMLTGSLMLEGEN